METKMATPQETRREAAAGPVLPPAEETGSTAETVRELRRFHLAGPFPGETADGFIPALLHPFRDARRLRSDYPYYLPPAAGDPAEGRGMTLAQLLDASAPGAAEARILRDNLLRLERAVRETVRGASAPVDAGAAITEAGERMALELALPAGDAEQLREGLRALAANLPEGSLLVPYGASAPMHLLRRALDARLLPARESFAMEARHLAGELRNLLEVDRRKRPEERNADAVGGAVGAVGSRFLDPGAFSGALGEHRGSLAMSPRRLERIHGAIAALDAVGEGTAEPPVLLTDGAVEGASLSGWDVRESEDPVADAITIFDERATELARALRALRVARLEVRDGYEPARHDPWLAEFDWQAFDRDELLLLPPVVAAVSAEALARRGMLSLSRLLLSGRPVPVVVPVNPTGNPGAAGSEDPAAGYRFEPAYLGMSHREALVQATSLARPAHMMQGMIAAAGAAHASLHVISGTPGGGAGVEPWLAASAAVEGRAQPLFHYDPEAGATWARRLDFSQNPAPDADWPAYTLEATGPDGDPAPVRMAFTFAEAALLDPALAGHFRAVPAGIQGDPLVPLDAWLGLDPEEASGKVPTAWGVDAEGRITRLAVTRRLALAARDRLNYWRTLQELAGVRSEYVETAVERARSEAGAEAEERIAALEARHAAELAEVREHAAEEIVDRLTAALLDADGGALSALAGGATAAVSGAPAPAAPAPAAFAAAAAPEPVEEEPEALDPYIDTELCTTCNECTNMNPLMFAYNADKKAFLKDPKAGTFAQLVKAAEACPAHIIHPGAPLDPSEPGLDDLKARAAKYN